MPYTKIEEVPAQIASHKGTPLTLEQANKWTEIYDALNSQNSIQNPAATAWTTWEEVYETKNGAWTLKSRDKSESMQMLEEIGFVESIEKGTDGLPGKARVLLIQAGKCKTKNRAYPADPLKELAESKMLDGLKMYDMHPPGSEKIPGANQAARSIKDYLSYIIPGTPQFSEGIRLKSGKIVDGITAMVKLVDHDFKLKMQDASETIGTSLNSICDAYMDNGIETVRKVRRAISADWVTEPNAGGLVLELVEAADPSEPNGKEVNNMEWKDITAEELTKNRPDLIPVITAGATKEATDKAAAAETKATEATAVATAAQAETTAAKAESKAATDKLAATEKEFTETKGKMVDATLKLKAIEMVESKAEKMNSLGKAAVMKAVLAKTFTTEKEMTEAIDSEVAKFPEIKPGQSMTGSQDSKETKPALQGKAREFAESIGLDAAQQERLAKVR